MKKQKTLAAQLAERDAEIARLTEVGYAYRDQMREEVKRAESAEARAMASERALREARDYICENEGELVGMTYLHLVARLNAAIKEAVRLNPTDPIATACSAALRRAELAEARAKACEQDAELWRHWSRRIADVPKHNFTPQTTYAELRAAIDATLAKENTGFDPSFKERMP